MIAYFNGRYLPQDQISVSPDDRGFLFADGIYDVVRAYEGRLFETRAHLDRLAYGAEALRFKSADFLYLGDVAERLVRDNGLTSGQATVYFQVTRGAASRTHHFPPAATDLTVYAAARPFAPHREDMEEGVNVLLVPDQRWARCDIKTVGLTANVLANQRAKESGAAESIFIRDGALLEGTHTNLFAVREGVVVTPPKTNYILGGITRQVVIKICGELGLSLREATLLEAEIDRAEEWMIVGTTTEVTPVVRFHGRPFRSGQPGPVTRRLQKALAEKTLAAS
jgi:D-alanine transaminase